jgi:hypothetical protein
LSIIQLNDLQSADTNSKEKEQQLKELAAENEKLKKLIASAKAQYSKKFGMELPNQSAAPPASPQSAATPHPVHVDTPFKPAKAKPAAGPPKAATENKKQGKQSLFIYCY